MMSLLSNPSWLIMIHHDEFTKWMFHFDHDDIIMDFKSLWCLYYPIYHDSSWWISDINVSFWSWWHNDGSKIIMVSLLSNHHDSSWYLFLNFRKKSSWDIMICLDELLKLLITVQFAKKFVNPHDQSVITIGYDESLRFLIVIQIEN